MRHGYTHFGTDVGKFSPPPALAALNPIEIRFNPVEAQSNETPVIHIQVFGIHSTGGHSTPFYGLDIICGAESTPYKVEHARAVPGNSHFRKIADGIYEVY